MQRITRLLLIFDGMGDRPIVELGEKTPLQAANLPVMDQLALEGQCGVADPVRSGTVATTVMGLWQSWDMIHLDFQLQGD